MPAEGRSIDGAHPTSAAPAAHRCLRHDPLTSQVQVQELDRRGPPGNHAQQAKLEKYFYASWH
jgi:hypothetical protein